MKIWSNDHSIHQEEYDQTQYRWRLFPVSFQEGRWNLHSPDL